LAEQEGNPDLAGQPVGEPRGAACGPVDNGNLCEIPDYYVTGLAEGRRTRMINYLIINVILRILPCR
jgi:hypothetical protein